MIFVDGDGTFIERDRLLRGAADRVDRRAALIKVFRRLLDGSLETVEFPEAFVELFSLAVDLGAPEDAVVGIVPGGLRGVVGFDRFVEFPAHEMELREIKLR